MMRPFLRVTSSSRHPRHWCINSHLRSLSSASSAAGSTFKKASGASVASFSTSSSSNNASWKVTDLHLGGGFILAASAIATANSALNSKKEEPSKGFEGCEGASTSLLATSAPSSTSSTPSPSSPPAAISTKATPITNIHTLYQLNEVIGEGGFGQVYRATRIKDGKPLALKCISKDYTLRSDFQREIDALHKLNKINDGGGENGESGEGKEGGHPHICRMYDILEGPDNYWLSMELIEGGEVFEHLIEKGAYSEAMAATFLRQFAEALSFMHAHGVVHADLKPENLMLSSWDEDKAEVKLVDFGCSVILDREAQGGQGGAAGVAGAAQSAPSTIAYDSPEKLLHHSGPTPASDVWAAGCILYIILTGSHPFDKYGTLTDEQIASKIKKVGKPKSDEEKEQVLAKMVFDDRTKGLSPSVISLLWYMLHPNPEKRTTSERFRRNRWVQGLTASWEVLDGSDVKLERFWQKEFRNRIFSKFQNTLGLKGGDVTDFHLKVVFQQIDEDGNGEIDEEELTRVLESAGVKKKDIRSIFNAINLDHENGISFEEFKSVLKNELPVIKDREYYQKRFRNVIAREMKTTHKSLEKESLHACARRLFYSMDLDKNGTLDAHELRMLLRKLGTNEQEISLLVASVDDDKDGDVTFEEFYKIISGASKMKAAPETSENS